MVAAALEGDETRALEIAEQLAAQCPEVGHLVYPSSERACRGGCGESRSLPRELGRGSR